MAEEKRRIKMRNRQDPKLYRKISTAERLRGSYPHIKAACPSTAQYDAQKHDVRRNNNGKICAPGLDFCAKMW